MEHRISMLLCVRVLTKCNVWTLSVCSWLHAHGLLSLAVVLRQGTTPHTHTCCSRDDWYLSWYESTKHTIKAAKHTHTHTYFYTLAFRLTVWQNSASAGAGLQEVCVWGEIDASHLEQKLGFAVVAAWRKFLLSPRTVRCDGTVTVETVNSARWRLHCWSNGRLKWGQHLPSSWMGR